MNDDQPQRQRQRRKHERGLATVGKHLVGIGGAKLTWQRPAPPQAPCPAWLSRVGPPARLDSGGIRLVFQPTFSRSTARGPDPAADATAIAATHQSTSPAANGPSHQHKTDLWIRPHDHPRCGQGINRPAAMASRPTRTDLVVRGGQSWSPLPPPRPVMSSSGKGSPQEQSVSESHRPPAPPPISHASG